jgi:DNA repair protein RadD
VGEGLARAAGLTWPDQIQVRQNGKFWEVVGYRFAADGQWSPRAVLPAEAA